MALRRETLATIRAGQAQAPKDFSVGLFILLLLVFWPAAVGYALWKGGVLEPILARLRGSSAVT